ncbi:MAG: hypothetical protein LBL82_08885, partial [Oscillospiraceae bacterium]|nr:hypothetical protein [Oscillospiraceae bacterium]
MKKTKIEEGKICPKYGRSEEQVNRERNRSGTRRCYCKHCGIMYTLEPKKQAYSEEIRQQAIKTYYAGASGRGVGKVYGFNKANVYNRIKKTTKSLESEQSFQQVIPQCLELDELYWFVEQKSKTETREKVYVMTMVSREPRTIAGFDVAQDKSSWRIQAMVDSRRVLK